MHVSAIIPLLGHTRSLLIAHPLKRLQSLRVAYPQRARVSVEHSTDDVFGAAVSQGEGKRSHAFLIALVRSLGVALEQQEAYVGQRTVSESEVQRQ